MLKSYGVVVCHKILESVQGPLVLVLRLRVWGKGVCGQGLTIVITKIPERCELHDKQLFIVSKSLKGFRIVNDILIVDDKTDKDLLKGFMIIRYS